MSRRLGARISPYIVLMILHHKFGFNVAVDQILHNTITEFFDISDNDVLPVLETVYCPPSLELMKQNMIDYRNTEKTLVRNNDASFRIKRMFFYEFKVFTQMKCQ